MSQNDLHPGEAEALAHVDALMRAQRRVEEGVPGNSEIMKSLVRDKFKSVKDMYPELPHHFHSLTDFIGDYFVRPGDVDREIHIEAVPMQIVLALFDLQEGVSYGERITSRAAGLHPQMYQVFSTMWLPKIMPRLFTPEQLSVMAPALEPLYSP